MTPEQPNGRRLDGVDLLAASLAALPASYAAKARALKPRELARA
jgi:hypothetical protein